MHQIFFSYCWTIAYYATLHYKLFSQKHKAKESKTVKENTFHCIFHMYNVLLLLLLHIFKIRIIIHCMYESIE